MPKFNNNDDDHQSAVESRNWINKLTNKREKKLPNNKKKRY